MSSKQVYDPNHELRSSSLQPDVCLVRYSHIQTQMIDILDFSFLLLSVASRRSSSLVLVLFSTFFSSHLSLYLEPVITFYDSFVDTKLLHLQLRFLLFLFLFLSEEPTHNHGHIH